MERTFKCRICDETETISSAYLFRIRAERWAEEDICDECGRIIDQTLAEYEQREEGKEVGRCSCECNEGCEEGEGREDEEQCSSCIPSDPEKHREQDGDDTTEAFLPTHTGRSELKE